MTIFLLLISVSAHAMGEKILYSWGSGQGVTVVGDSDASADATVQGYEVLWDERHDGPMPKNIDPFTVSRKNGKLVSDKVKVDRKAAEETAKAAKLVQEEAEKSAFNDLKAKVLAETASPEEVRKVLISVLKKME